MLPAMSSPGGSTRKARMSSECYGVFWEGWKAPRFYTSLKQARAAASRAKYGRRHDGRRFNEFPAPVVKKFILAWTVED